MSEEVLKALMQLFAIIANQDDGAQNLRSDYVNFFLRSQISEDRVTEFEEYYNSFIKQKEEGAESPRRTSMKDSVRTLAICKKINKTLNQKQKFIVFTRLLEFVGQDEKESFSRTELVNAVSDVFNIGKENYEKIARIIRSRNGDLDKDFLRVSSTAAETGCRQYTVNGFSGSCLFLLLRDVNIILFVYDGHAELSLNGLPVKAGQVNIIPAGSSLRHPKGTIFYSDVINLFLGETFETSVDFFADIKQHCHPDGTVALRELAVHEQSGTLVGIMGASGSGKTTLLNVMSGNDRVTNGSVSINGHDLHTAQNMVQGYVGFIPQDDLLIEELTVYQNLFFNAQLSFGNATERELGIKVIKLLNALGLSEVKDIRVGNPLNKKISGGQRKRLNIALELIREPQILFVDEPTSGLSSRDSENVMDLLKELSHKGKLIFVVIHQPSSDIYKLFDRMLILDTGGYPVYYGNPIEALVYVKKQANQVNSHLAECHSCGSVNPETLFNLIEAKEIDEYGNYTAKRKMSPEGWFGLFRKNFSVKRGQEQASTVVKLLSEIPGRFRQWMIFVKRDVLSKFANLQYLLINILEVPLLALFLAVAIRYINRNAAQQTYSYHHNENIPAFFFMAIVVALLVGLTISAEEIYKDQKILKREKFLRLSRGSYLLSKIFILFTISAVQSLILSVIGFLVLQIPSGLLPFWGVIFSVFCSANLIGLLLSSTFNSPVTIYIIIPLIIIPQMLLGGAMFKFSKLNGWLGGDVQKVPVMSQFMVSRWAYEGIAVNQFQQNQYGKQMFPVSKLESQLNYHLAYCIPKLEELQSSMEKDTSMSDGKRSTLQHLYGQILKNELQEAGELLNDWTVEDDDTLASLQDALNTQYELVAAQKQELEEQLREQGIVREAYVNKSLDENLTNATEKNKILVDSATGRFVQIIDPVYRNPETTASVSTGLQSHFYAPYKVLFGNKISTTVYNTIMIWILNVVVFVLLYANVFSKLFRRTARIMRMNA